MRIDAKLGAARKPMPCTTRGLQSKFFCATNRIFALRIRFFSVLLLKLLGTGALVCAVLRRRYDWQIHVAYD